MWKQMEAFAGIVLFSGMASALLSIPQAFIRAAMASSVSPEWSKRLESPYPLLILFGLMVGWMSHGAVVKDDVDYMNNLRLCMRTNPNNDKPFDVCAGLNEFQKEALALPYAECRMALGPLHPWGELACKRPSKDGWRL